MPPAPPPELAEAMSLLQQGARTAAAATTAAQTSEGAPPAATGTCALAGKARLLSPSERLRLRLSRGAPSFSRGSRKPPMTLLACLLQPVTMLRSVDLANGVDVDTVGPLPNPTDIPHENIR